MIEARGLVKRYGDTAAVDDPSFTIRPGQVTGFLGPNGAGDVVPVITSTVSLNNPPHMFSAWGELAVFAGYTVILLAAGAVAFSRRDA